MHRAERYVSFMPERDLDSLPDSTDQNGPCPRCGLVAAFNPVSVSVPLKPDGAEQATVLMCQGCRDSIVVVEQRRELTPGQPIRFEGIHWWPMPGSGDLDPDIPAAVGSAYSEGMRALSVKAPRAAVVMYRGMLAQVVADKGSAVAQAKHTLYDKLEQMSLDGSLHPSLVEWAKEIRVLGNAAAHPDALAPVSEEEAADLGRLCRQLLNVLYEVPARIARSRATRGSNP
jgi:Domain of unknown function (DUF4145)